MDRIASALAHCRRDDQGLLKLSDLWSNAKAAKPGVSKHLKRHAALLGAVIVRKGGCKHRGAFAPEDVARQLAKFFSPKYLWCPKTSEAEISEEGQEARNERATPEPFADITATSSESSSSQPLEETGSANLASTTVTTSTGVLQKAMTGHHLMQAALARIPENASTTVTSAGVLVELGVLLKRDVTQLRNAGCILSVIDVAMVITGLARNQASEAVRELLKRYPEVQGKILNCKFPGERQRNTPGAEIETIIEIIMLLPGAAAATTRCQAAKLLVRYIGADMKIIEELQVMKAAQSNLQNVPEEQRTPEEEVVRLCGEAVQQADVVSQQLAIAGPVIFRLPPPPIVMETCPSGCMDDGPAHFYILRIPSQPGAPEDGDTYRGGRTKDFDARMLKHRNTYGDGSYMALCAPNYGHVEQLWHRHIRAQAISPKSNEEQILAAKVDLSLVPGFVMELHKKRQTDLKLENISQVSRKRTREDAEEELALAETDAKRELVVAELGAKRELAVAELGAKRDLAREREQLMLRLAAEGNAEAIKFLFAPRQ